jgi:hypothetical protein
VPFVNRCPAAPAGAWGESAYEFAEKVVSGRLERDEPLMCDLGSGAHLGEPNPCVRARPIGDRGLRHPESGDRGSGVLLELSELKLDVLDLVARAVDLDLNLEETLLDEGTPIGERRNHGRKLTTP